MKFSEAMRLGAMALPAVHGPIFNRVKGKGICGACAIGSALWAAASEDERNDWADNRTCHPDLIEHFWPWTTNKVTSPAGKFNSDQYTSATVICLFELYGWTREQIADWIETIEAQYDPSTTNRKDESYDTEATLGEVTTCGEHS